MRGTMLSHWSTSATFPSLPLPHTFSSRNQIPPLPNPILLRKATNNTSSIVCLAIGVERFAEIAHNKVLVAAVVSTAIGQLSKPFTSAILYGKNMDFKNVIRAGGFPSTHSAGVVAAATSLGLERGFSDSLFGATAIFAGLVMYDAQAVRREVGKHANVLNKKILSTTQKNSIPHVNTDGIDSKPGTENSESFVPLLSISEKASAYKPSAVIRSSRSSSKLSSLTFDDESIPNINGNSATPLEESIGHTEVEVIAGALLGFLVTLVVYSLM